MLRVVFGKITRAFQMCQKTLACVNFLRTSTKLNNAPNVFLTGGLLINSYSHIVI